MFRNKRLEYKRLFSFLFLSRIYTLNFGIETRIFIRTCGAELWNCFESIIFKRKWSCINVANVVILARIYINKSKTRLHRGEMYYGIAGCLLLESRATRTIARRGNAFRHSLGIIHQVFTKIVHVLSRCRRSRCIYEGEFPRNRPVHL